MHVCIGFRDYGYLVGGAHIGLVKRTGYRTGWAFLFLGSGNVYTSMEARLYKLCASTPHAN